MRTSRTIPAARTTAVLAVGASAALTLALLPAANAVQSPVDAHQAHASVDARADALVRPTRTQLDAISTIVKAADAGTRVTYDDRFGTPRTIYPLGGGTLTDPRDGRPVDIARDWLAANSAALGLDGGDIDGLVVTQNHRLGTGTTVVAFAQTFGGVPTVHGGSMTVVVRD